MVEQKKILEQSEEGKITHVQQVTNAKADVLARWAASFPFRKEKLAA